MSRASLPAPLANATPPPPGPELSADDRRWLHDKFERLSAEEGQLAATRTTYFATIAAVLVTGLIVIVVNTGGQHRVVGTAAALLAGVGILFSAVWAALLHRTADAQRLWREAAVQLESIAPPIRTEVRGMVPSGRRAKLEVDLGRPYTVHAIRFAPTRDIAWPDRIDPWRLSEVMPLTFLGMWILVFLAAIFWALAGV